MENLLIEPALAYHLFFASSPSSASFPSPQFTHQNIGLQRDTPDFSIYSVGRLKCSKSIRAKEEPKNPARRLSSLLGSTNRGIARKVKTKPMNQSLTPHQRRPSSVLEYQGRELLSLLSSQRLTQRRTSPPLRPPVGSCIGCHGAGHHITSSTMMINTRLFLCFSDLSVDQVIIRVVIIGLGMVIFLVQIICSKDSDSTDVFRGVCLSAALKSRRLQCTDVETYGNKTKRGAEPGREWMLDRKSGSKREEKDNRRI